MSTIKTAIQNWDKPVFPSENLATELDALIDQIDAHSHSLGDLTDVTATGEGAGNGFDADLLDGKHADAFVHVSGDTMGGTLTLSDGSTAASRNWVNNNADVPNADYADSAGDADTVDGYHALDFGKEKNVASFTSSDTTTDINLSSWTIIPWDTQLEVDSGYTHDPSGSPGSITFDNAGTYRVHAMVTYNTTDLRQNPGVKFAINGTRRNALGLSGYSRHASGHYEASNYIEEIITVNAGDTLTVQTTQYGNSGTCTLRANESVLNIEQVSEVTGSGRDNILLAEGTTTDFNQSSWANVSWSSTTFSDSSYTFDGTTATIQRDGQYEITAEADFSSSGGSRQNPNLGIQQNGSWVGVIGRSGYMRDAEGHNHSSIHARAVVSATAGDTIHTEAYGEADSGGSIVPDRAQFYIKKLDR